MASLRDVLPSLTRLARLSRPHPPSALLRPTRLISQPTARHPLSLPTLTILRHQHTIPRPRTSVPPNPSQETPSALTTPPQPSYELSFTCTPCSTRSRHTISKQGYHHGTVLVTCPGCKNRHIIADNLKIFGEKKMNIEDILREKGQDVRKGTVSAEGDIEFWEDGTVTVRGEDEKDGSVKRWVKKEGAEAEREKEMVPGSTFASAKTGGKEEK